MPFPFRILFSNWNKIITTWANDVKTGDGKGIKHSKLRTYALFKSEHCKEVYLDAVQHVSHRISLAKFRTNYHKLNIEIGRYRGFLILNNESKFFLRGVGEGVLAYLTPPLNNLASSGNYGDHSGLTSRPSLSPQGRCCVCLSQYHRDVSLLLPHVSCRRLIKQTGDIQSTRTEHVPSQNTTE